MSDARRLTKTGTPGVFRREGGGYVVRFRDQTGNDRKRCASTLAEARRIASEVRTDLTRGEYRDTSRATLAEYYAVWILTFTGRTSRGIRPDTIKRYQADM